MKAIPHTYEFCAQKWWFCSLGSSVLVFWWLHTWWNWVEVSILCSWLNFKQICQGTIITLNSVFFFLIPSELQAESPNMNSHYMQLWWWKFFRRHERKHIKYLIKCYFGLNEWTHSLTLQKSRFDIHIMVNYSKDYTIVFLLLAGCWGFIFWISANIINFIGSPACKLGWEWKSEGYFGLGFFIIWNGVR